MIMFFQVGWFNPDTKRFCYTDELDYRLKQNRGDGGYTHHVFVIDPVTTKKLSIQIEMGGIEK